MVGSRSKQKLAPGCVTAFLCIEKNIKHMQVQFLYDWYQIKSNKKIFANDFKFQNRVSRPWQVHWFIRLDLLNKFQQPSITIFYHILNNTYLHSFIPNKILQWFFCGILDIIIDCRRLKTRCFTCNNYNESWEFSQILQPKIQGIENLVLYLTF